MHVMRNGRLAVVLALVGAGLLTSQPAEAAPLEHEHWSESSDQIISPCGFDVRFQTEASGSFVLVAHGDGLAYWHENVSFVGGWTGLESGRTMTQTLSFHNQDQRVVDNGDGTLTITEKSVGPLKVFGSDGRLLFVDTSALWWTITVDDGGTPADPYEDALISESDPFKDVGTQGADGRDFCADLTAQVL